MEETNLNETNKFHLEKLFYLLSSEDVSNIRLGWQLAQGLGLAMNKVIDTLNYIVESFEEYYNVFPNESESIYLFNKANNKIPLEILFLEFPNMIRWLPWVSTIHYHFKVLSYHFPTHQIFESINDIYKNNNKQNYELLLEDFSNKHIALTNWLISFESDNIGELISSLNKENNPCRQYFMGLPIFDEDKLNKSILFEKLNQYFLEGFQMITKISIPFDANKNDDIFWVILVKEEEIPFKPIE